MDSFWKKIHKKDLRGLEIGFIGLCIAALGGVAAVFGAFTLASLLGWGGGAVVLFGLILNFHIVIRRGAQPDD